MSPPNFYNNGYSALFVHGPGTFLVIIFGNMMIYPSLKLVKRTPIPEDEPISWMTFDVSGKAAQKASAASETM